jgi:homotetrameric cytidine deaminase
VTAVDEGSLVAAAREARAGAYAPYSGFRVGAALLATDGRVFTGANVENASSPAGICAERVALSQAVVAGAREFAAIAVAADGDGPCTPCGLCRQTLHEFAPDLLVLAAGAAGAPARYVLARDLLPAGFGSARVAVERASRRTGQETST